MELTYTWKLTRLKKTDDPSAELNDIIVQTYWECTGTDADGISGTFNGATPFEPDMVDAENFTTYENLTEAQVLGWIQDVVENNPGYKAHIEGRSLKSILMRFRGQNLVRTQRQKQQQILNSRRI